MKELAEVGKDDKTSGVRAVVVNDRNPHRLKGTIQGPQGTPYEGGVFEIDIDIPKQYPFEPPKMKFSTKIWHPNISSQTGAICLVRSFCAMVVDGTTFFVVIVRLKSRRLCVDPAEGHLGPLLCITFGLHTVVLTLVSHRKNRTF